MMTPTSMVNNRTSVIFAALDGAYEEFLDDYETLLDCYASERILDAKYGKENLPLVLKHQKHLSGDKQQRLLSIMKKHESLFDGTLSRYQHRDVSLELLPGAKQIHSRLYSVARSQEEVFKK